MGKGGCENEQKSINNPQRYFGRKEYYFFILYPALTMNMLMP